MKSKIEIVIVLLLLFTNIYSQADNRFNTYKPSDGLSNNIVRAIAQDFDGYIWFGTADGLNRFDGYEFKVFRHDPTDSTSLPSNSINSLKVDPAGHLWIGSVDNVSKLNPDGSSFTTIAIDNEDNTTLPSPIVSIFFDSKGRMFIGTGIHNIQELIPEENKFRNIPFDSNLDLHGYHLVSDIEELSNGNLIAADNVNGPLIYHSGSNIFRPFLEGKSLIPNEVNTIHEDTRGNIWFGGDNFLVKYMPTVNEFEKISYLESPRQSDRISDIIDDKDGNIIVRSDTKGIITIDPVSNKVLSYNIGKIARSYQIIQDKNGIFWTALSGGIEKFDSEKIEFSHLPFNSVEESSASQQSITTILPDNSNPDIIWLGTSEKGLYKYYIKEKTFKEITTGPEFNIPLKSILTITQSKDENIWFYIRQDSQSLIYGYNPIKNRFTSYNPGVYDLAVSNDVTQIRFKSKNELMVSGGSGLMLFNLEEKRGKYIPSIMRRTFRVPLWEKLMKIATQSTPVAKLVKMGEAVNESKSFPVKKTSKYLIICQGEGEIRGHSMYDYGSISDASGTKLWAMDEIRNTFNAGGGSKNRINIKCLELQPGDYTINFITDQGHSYNNWNVIPPKIPDWYGIQVYEIDDDSYNFINKKLEQDNRHKVLIIDAVESFEISKKDPDVLWIGSRGNGLVKFNTRDSSSTQYYFAKEKWGAEVTSSANPANFITHIYEDRNGIVWVLSRTNLVRLDPETNTWEKIDEKYGLTSKSLNGITEDFLGNLWITTPNEIFSFNKNEPRDKWILLKYNIKDGLTESLITSDVKTQKDGKIIFAGKNGIQTFYPKPSNITKPDIIISGIYISEKPLKDYNIVLTNSAQPNKSLELNYSQNDLSFEFASVHFANPDRNRIAYKMDGVQEDWINTKRRYAAFPNLDPGAYIFRVKGANGDGIWNDVEKQIIITILPPWWRTTIAYILYGVILIAAIFATDRIQRRRLLAKARAANAIKEAELRAQLAEAENERKSKELEEARALQLSMLPKELPQLPNLDIAVFMQTATEVGGDYYDFHVGMDGTLTVVIGDATGHGMKAGTMVTAAKSLFNSYAPNPDILYSFQEITRCIKQMNFGKLSMCLTMLKIKGNKMQISTAGMPPSFIFRRDTRVIEEHLFKAMPLGSMENFPYKIKDTTLKAGDTILLMSDGLPELSNTKDEMYGYKRIRSGFEDVAEKSPEEIISYLKNEGASWVDNEDPDDDVTFVVIKVK